MTKYRLLLRRLADLLSAGWSQQRALFEVFGPDALDPLTARLILSDMSREIADA